MYATAEQIYETIANWVNKYRYAVSIRGDFVRLGPEAVARVAQDIGLSSSELVRLATEGPQAADQLPKLLVALGVDPDQFDSANPAVTRDLQRLCIMCAHKSQCEHELAAGTAAENYESFCPNAISLDSLFHLK